MIKRIILLTLSLTVSALALTDQWSINVNDHTAVQRTYKRGESIDMRITLRDGLRPLDLTGATARWYWYTNAVDNLWWTNAAAIPLPRSGLVSAQWTPAMDTGAALYPYWVGLWMPGATSPLWRVTGTIRLLGSPGLNPNSQPVPVRTLDFAAITITNAPWVTAADWASGSNALASALMALGSNTTSQISAAVSNGVNEAIAQSATTASGIVSVAISGLPAPSTDALRVVSTNAVAWIDGDGNRWRIDTHAETNDAQRILWDSGLYPEFGLLTLDQIAPYQWRKYLDNDLYAYVGDIYYDDIAAYIAVGQTDEWPIGLIFWQADPPGLAVWPKTYTRSNGHTGWVDRVVSYQAVTSKWAEVANKADVTAFPTNYIAGFALPIPGTNVVYQLSVDSNRVLTVWEVLP